MPFSVLSRAANGLGPTLFGLLAMLRLGSGPEKERPINWKAGRKRAVYSGAELETIQGAIIVRGRNLIFGVAIVIVALALAGCGHKLVAHGGDTTVPVFPDKASFERL